MNRFFSLLLAFLIAVISPAFGVTVRPNENGSSTVAAVLGKTEFADGVPAEISFERQNINTVVFTSERQDACVIQIFSDGSLIYSREGNEKTRFCAFKTIETDNITIKILGGSAAFDRIEISDKRADTDGFRVTSYFVASSVAQPGSIRAESFDVITDAILFGCAVFDENGNLTVDEALLKTALSNLRSSIGSRSVGVYINILGPDAQGSFEDWSASMEDKAQRHSSAFNSGRLEPQLVALIEEHGFDGVFFDYEFPIKQKHWRSFNKFILSLDRVTDKKIGMAVPDWDIGLSRKALRAVDMLEVMQYDLFDSRGHHSNFDTAVSGIVAADKNFISRSKIDLGIPFYGRPADGSAIWYDYRAYAAALGNGADSVVADDGRLAYFNSRQTVYDKTAYALSRGAGGMMVWHYACDTAGAMSLFGAMGSCLADRTA